MSRQLVRNGSSPDLTQLLAQVRSCTVCSNHLPLGPKPLLQASANSRIMIVSQAPGRKAHQAGLPFADPSGDRLRSWLGISSEDFYDPEQVAILPMGFCFPGSGKGGDLPPRPECAQLWRHTLLSHLRQVELTLVIGKYAMAWHLPEQRRSVTELVAGWRDFWPGILPLPHPSPRNQRWLRQNPWFEVEVLPLLQQRVAAILRQPDLSAD